MDQKKKKQYLTILSLPQTNSKNKQKLDYTTKIPSQRENKRK